MKIVLISAYWPNRPFGVTWCDLPWAMHDAGIIERLSENGHEVISRLAIAQGDRAGDLQGAFDLAGQVGEFVRSELQEGALPIILCGSCSVASLGAVAGMGSEGTGVVWLDAHPDLNTPSTTISGLFEGMALATILGLCWEKLAKGLVGFGEVSSQSVALFGVRDFEIDERWVMDQNRLSVSNSAAEVVARISACRRSYVHLDMDVHDALEVRTNGFCVPNGPTSDDIHDVLAAIPNIGVMSITGLDPAAPDGEEAIEIAIDHICTVAESMEARR